MFNFIGRLQNKPSPTLLLQDYPLIYRAYSLNKDDRSVRWQIEAGLLTAATHEEIALYTGQQPSVVDTYAQIFYNIRPYLSAPGFVSNEVLLPAARHGLAERDYDFMFKTMAYFAGWETFKCFIECRELTPKSYHYVRSAFKANVMKLGWKASMLVNVNQFNAVELMDLCLRLEEMERNQGPAPAQAEAGVLIQALLNQCRMTIISSDTRLESDEPRVANELNPERGLRFVPTPKEGATNGQAQ